MQGCTRALNTIVAGQAQPLFVRERHQGAVIECESSSERGEIGSATHGVRAQSVATPCPANLRRRLPDVSFRERRGGARRCRDIWRMYSYTGGGFCLRQRNTTRNNHWA